MAVEDVAAFTADHFQWTWQETLQQPAWLVWGLYRTALDRAEQQRRNR